MTQQTRTSDFVVQNPNRDWGGDLAVGTDSDQDLSDCWAIAQPIHAQFLISEPEKVGGTSLAPFVAGLLLSMRRRSILRSMNFIKMHGAGNDYVYVDCFKEKLTIPPEHLAVEISDRNKGIGGDGLILICPSEVADAQMRMFNADGSESEMCGNGIRCVAKYVSDYGICANKEIEIETGAGILALEVFKQKDKVHSVRVDMGKPVLQPNLVPTLLEGDPNHDGYVVDHPIEIAGYELQVTCVSMGNPHCVVFVDEATDELVLGLGPKLETDPRFPSRVNVEFVELVSAVEVRQRTWERGSGETLACGTGASAVCVAGVLSGRTERQLTNHLRGGTLELEWNESTGHVFMTGPAVEVYHGTYSPR